MPAQTVYSNRPDNRESSDRLASLTVGPADREKAQLIADMYNAALGKLGVMAAGHEPYPDPSLFSREGIVSDIDSDERKLVVAELDGRPVGAMIIDKIHDHACEFNCMAVRLDCRGLGLGRPIVEACRRLVDETFFTANSTELVTHSLASQRAHFASGYNRLTGFGFCQYPRVFFKNHPESCLWATMLQGHLARELPDLRAKLGKSIGVPLSEFRMHLTAVGRGFAGLTDYEAELAYDVMRKRNIYVPPAYAQLAGSILAQFSDSLDYTVDTSGAGAGQTDGARASAAVEIDFKEGFEHSYIYLPPAFDPGAGLKPLAAAIEKLRSAGKRFILVRMRANYASTIETAEFLRSQGFVFHTLVPLYMSTARDGTRPPVLDDMLGMQWVAPYVLAQNPLPGDTGSVVQLHGYPENLSGQIVGTIRAELRRQKP